MNAPRKLRALLVGIAGTSRDFLLSLPTLKAFAVQDEQIASRCDISVLHHKYILPSFLDDACAKIANDIEGYEPDLLGFSTYVWNIEAVLRIAAATKKARPQTLILLGGPEIAASNVMAGTFDDSPVDFIISGEGEVPFQMLLRHLLASETDVGDVPRLCYRRHGALVNKDALQDLVRGILPTIADGVSPYLSGAVPAELMRRPGIQANVETQRGCTFRCAYCLYHANFPKIRYREPGTVVQELAFINAHGIEHCRITDANFLSNRDFAARILHGMIEKRLTMSLFVEIIPSFVNSTLADLMRDYRAISTKNDILVRGYPG